MRRIEQKIKNREILEIEEILNQIYILRLAQAGKEDFKPEVEKLQWRLQELTGIVPTSKTGKLDLSAFKKPPQPAAWKKKKKDKK